MTTPLTLTRLFEQAEKAAPAYVDAMAALYGMPYAQVRAHFLAYGRMPGIKNRTADTAVHTAKQVLENTSLQIVKHQSARIGQMTHIGRSWLFYQTIFTPTELEDADDRILEMAQYAQTPEAADVQTLDGTLLTLPSEATLAKVAQEVVTNGWRTMQLARFVESRDFTDQPHLNRNQFLADVRELTDALHSTRYKLIDRMGLAENQTPAISHRQHTA